MGCGRRNCHSVFLFTYCLGGFAFQLNICTLYGFRRAVRVCRKFLGEGGKGRGVGWLCFAYSQNTADAAAITPSPRSHTDRASSSASSDATPRSAPPPHTARCTSSAPPPETAAQPASAIPH